MEFVFVLLATCIWSASGVSIHSSRTRQNLIKNLTLSYSSFLDDIYYYLSTINNVSETCRLDMNQIQDLATLGDADALKIFDSSGKPSSGILEGGVYFIGYYPECVNTVVNAKNKSLEAKYCLLHLNVSRFHQESVPDPSKLVLKQATKPPTIGICIPSSCSPEDVQFATKASLKENYEDVEGSVAVCHSDPSGFSKDVYAILFLCFESLLVLLVVVATSYDYFLHLKEKRDATMARSISTELLYDQKPRTVGTRLQYVFAFSMYTNGHKIFAANTNDNIACLHGLRFFSMALIIFGHSYSFAGTILYLRNPESANNAPKGFVSQVFANGTFAVDTFFFMSGLLVSYTGTKSLETAKKKLTWLLSFYVHRYLRVTPLMMGVILNCALFLRYFGSGPDWLGSILMYDEWCRQQWWVNALYIHNFYRTEEMCLSHSWYLATDMQMYIVAPLMFLPLVWSWKAGFASMISFLLATTIATAVITAHNNYPAIPYINHITPPDVMNAFYKNVYIKPYCRIGPFIVGMALGYFLFKKKVFIMNKLQVAAGWFLSVALGFTIIYLMWPANQGILPSNSEAAAYSALARTAWGGCLAWLVFSCFYGYGGIVNDILSRSVWVPFSRLTFPAYLIHPVIMSAVYGSSNGVSEFSVIYMLYMFIGHICITYFLSFFLSLLYESPFVALGKIILTPTLKPEDANTSQKKSLEDFSHKE